MLILECIWTCKCHHLDVHIGLHMDMQMPPFDCSCWNALGHANAYILVVMSTCARTYGRLHLNGDIGVHINMQMPSFRAHIGVHMDTRMPSFRWSYWRPYGHVNGFIYMVILGCIWTCKCVNLHGDIGLHMDM